jgi:lipoyl synthase
MDKIFRAYYVWPKFPSISMSGTACSLSCKHCNHTYLHDMKELTTPQQLQNACDLFVKQEAVGFLLSGGCDKNGKMLNLSRLLPTIKKIKKETDLIIKLHTGFVDKKLAEDIVSAGIDIASVEIAGSNQSIQEIFDFNATVKSYTQTLLHLESADMPYIVPHVCIGLHYGDLRGEFHALDIIKNNCDPSVIVFIVFRPTKGTPMQNCSIPTPDSVSKVITYAKSLFPNKDLSLGCIRPRSTLRNDIEQAAVQAGVTRMEIPSKNTLTIAQSMGYRIKKISACCALPEELE